MHIIYVCFAIIVYISKNNVFIKNSVFFSISNEMWKIFDIKLFVSRLKDNPVADTTIWVHKSIKKLMFSTNNKIEWKQKTYHSKWDGDIWSLFQNKTKSNANEMIKYVKTKMKYALFFLFFFKFKNKNQCNI